MCSAVDETTVFRVGWTDLDRYQSLLVDLADPPYEVWDQFAGAPLADAWVPLPVYIEQPRLEQPSFWKLIGAAVIAMEDEVIDLVAEFIYPVGELLPLIESGTGRKFSALNILRDIDCLSPSAVQVESLTFTPDFLAHRLPESGLFKVPQVIG